MSELQAAIEETLGQIAGARTAASYSVVLSISEAQLLVDAAQLAGPLRERCGLLGRALNAIWGLVSEEDQQALTAVLEKAAGRGIFRRGMTVIRGDVDRYEAMGIE